MIDWKIFVMKVWCKRSRVVEVIRVTKLGARKVAD